MADTTGTKKEGRVEGRGRKKGKERKKTHLDHQQPDFLKYGLIDIFLHALNSLAIQRGSLTSKLCQQPNLLLIRYLFLEEYLLCLGESDMNQGFHGIPA